MHGVCIYARKYKKSIKRGRFDIFKASTFTGCMLFSQVLPYKTLRNNLCQLPLVTCKTWTLGVRFYTFTLEKMKKTTTINGDVYTYGRFEPVYNYKTDIYDLYDRPSTYKVVAFNEWNKKLVEIYGMTGNSCCFSIYGYVKDEDGHLHNVKITRGYNWILD